MMFYASLKDMLLRTYCARSVGPSRQMLDELVPLPPTHRAHGLDVPTFAAFNRYRSNREGM